MMAPLPRAAMPGTAACASIFEEWVESEIEAGLLVPILQDWWQSFPGPYLYFPGGGLVRRRCARSWTSSNHVEAEHVMIFRSVVRSARFSHHAARAGGRSDRH